MNFKLSALAAAALLAASAPTFAAMADATSGNGELLLNLRYYVGANDSDANDMSAVFDLGVAMNDVLAWNGVAGFTQTWDLRAANYGGAWDDLLVFAAANPAAIEFNVIALDNTDKTTQAGGSRYLTTADVASFPSLTNTNLNGFDNVNAYVLANNGRGTHASEANGASTAISGGAANTYFGSIGGSTDGDNWVGKTTQDTTKTLATAQNFWFLTTSSTSSTAQATKLVFGYDVDGNGTIGVGEFGEWSIDAQAGTLTYTNPAPIPEADTYALMLAGLGLVGFAARRRLNRV